MRLRYALMFFPLMGAIACAFFGFEEHQLAQASSDEPEEISLRELIRRGPEGNPNIVLKDFKIFEDYIYQKKLVSGRWTKVWVPIIPADNGQVADGGQPAIRAFIYSSDVGNNREVQQRFNQPKLHGMINPNAPKPGIIGSVLIKQNYPGTEPNKCIIIEQGKQPAGALKFVLLGVGFALCLGTTIGIWLLARLLDHVESKPEEGKRPVARRVAKSEPQEDQVIFDDEDPPHR